MNTVYLLGRVYKEPELKKTDDEHEINVAIIEVKREYKNSNGEYESDLVEIELFGNENLEKYFPAKGELIGIIGKINTYTDDKGNNKSIVQAKKITMLGHADHKKETERDVR